MNSAHIGHLLATNTFRQSKLVVPNVSYGFLPWESDVLVINKDDSLSEVEIKISVADFRRDSKKQKWHSHGMQQEFKRLITRFYYAMPIEIYERVKDEVPDFAGVIVVRDNRFNPTQTVKRATSNRSCQKLSVEDQLKLARLMCFRYWSNRKGDK